METQAPHERCSWCQALGGGWAGTLQDTGSRELALGSEEVGLERVMSEREALGAGPRRATGGGDIGATS